MNVVAVAVATCLAASGAVESRVSDPWESALARGDLATDTGDHAGAVAAYREGLAAAAEAEPATQVDILRRLAKAQRTSYANGGGYAALEGAEASLADAEARCVAPELADDQGCVQARQELLTVRQELTDARVRGEGIEPPLAPTPVAPVSAAVPPPPPPTPVGVDRSAQTEQQYRTADRFVIAGAVLMGVGGGALVLLALPAWGLSAIAQDRADSDPLLASETTLQDRADRRRRFAIGAAIAGGGLVVIGVPFLGAGLGMKSKLDKHTASVGVAPTRDGFTLGVTGRF